MSLHGGYVRDILKGCVPTPFVSASTLDLENDVPTPTSRQKVLKSFILGSPPEVQILAPFLYILNKKNNRKGYLLKKRLDVVHFFTVPFAFLLRCSELGWELPIHTVIKKKSFWPSRCWSQMMWEALAFFKLLHKCSSKFSPFLRAKLCCCWYLTVGAGWGTSSCVAVEAS